MGIQEESFIKSMRQVREKLEDNEQASKRKGAYDLLSRMVWRTLQTHGRGRRRNNASMVNV